MKSSITQMNLIEPKKSIIEDLEILAFENEEELKYYTIWHEALVNKKKGIANEFVDLISTIDVASKTPSLPKKISSNQQELEEQQNQSTTQVSQSPNGLRIFDTSQANKQANRYKYSKLYNKYRDNNKTKTTFGPKKTLNNYQLELTEDDDETEEEGEELQEQQHQLQQQHQIQPPLQPPKLPNGLTILNTLHTNNKQATRYKYTKLYNKYRGRQMRRNFVIEKQRNAKIEAELSKCQLNTWLAYTALQALRLPNDNKNQLSAATTNSGKIFTSMAQQQPATPVFSTASPQLIQVPTQPISVPFLYNTNAVPPQSPQQIQQPQQQQHKAPPMHLVYIDPGNIITYSNRINPQQIIEYRKKPPIQPSSATSKKSSAASYDVYEIMEVLANTNKTNVTITRNANRPSNQTSSSNIGSIYSHSVNANTPGIVSTQLHLQARSYVDLMSKFYAEERELLKKEKERMDMEDYFNSYDLLEKYMNS